jgi:D-arabinitol 4-dehydrogenase
MVDRITPRTTDTLRHEIEGKFPGFGATAVQTEEYTQWVIEDDFASEFPDLSEVGVVITKDIEPYEEAKIRILNGGHTSLAYMGVLSGYDTFDQVMSDPRHLDHFRKLQVEEIAPTIDIDIPFDIHEYINMVEERISSKINVDNLDRICMDGFTKFHTFVVPSLRKCLEQGKKPVHIYKSIAAWYIYCRKFARGCTRIKYNEPNWVLLEPLLRDGAVETFVRSERLWGDIPKTYITFSRDLITILLSQTYECELDLLVDD